MALERQELFCTECSRYVQFSVDTSLNGNHVFNCPNCGHEHCRVVQGGRITGIRWDVRGGPAITVSYSTITSTGASTWDTVTTSNSSGTTNVFIYNSWMNTR